MLPRLGSLLVWIIVGGVQVSTVVNSNFRVQECVCYFQSPSTRLEGR